MRYQFFYECAIKAYALAIRIAAWFIPKAKLWVLGRKGWRHTLASEMRRARENKQQVAWFHAASLGEFEQGRPVIEAFRKAYPDYFILLTFYSPSGYEIRKDYEGADAIGYLPADTGTNAKDFVNLVDPTIAFFIKYEFWANYLLALKRKQAVVVLFAALFRPDQVFFKPWGGFFRDLLANFDAILVQNTTSFELVAKVKGVKEVRVAGDTRFDRVANLVENRRTLPEIERFVGQAQCLIVGSAWDRDMEILLPALNQLGGQLKAIIAPHEIKPAEIARWQSQLKLGSMVYSEYKKSDFLLPSPSPNYLLIDNIGMLSSLYAYGTMAYIGGAFGEGLHNILEAATYGRPLFFGNKNYEKFPEATQLLVCGVAQAVGGVAELQEAVQGLLEHPKELKEKSIASRRFVIENTGATDAVMQVVRKLVN